MSQSGLITHRTPTHVCVEHVHCFSSPHTNMISEKWIYGTFYLLVQDHYVETVAKGSWAHGLTFAHIVHRRWSFFTLVYYSYFFIRTL
jgi:hypothetical protein